MPRIPKTPLIAVAALVPAMAVAQTNCADRDVVVSKLETGYGESFAGGGLQSSSSIFEVWHSPDAGTWTILMTRPDGKSCVMASGTDWRETLPGYRKQPAGVPG